MQASEILSAWQEYKDSDEGRQSGNPHTLPPTEKARDLLEKRLQKAFYAGIKFGTGAVEKEAQRQSDNSLKCFKAFKPGRSALVVARSKKVAISILGVDEVTECEIPDWAKENMLYVERGDGKYRVHAPLDLRHLCYAPKDDEW